VPAAPATPEQAVSPSATPTPVAASPAAQLDPAPPEPGQTVAPEQTPAATDESDLLGTVDPKFSQALPRSLQLEDLFGGGIWELDLATSLEPGLTGQTTCQEPDPPFMDGVNLKYQSIDHHQYLLVQVQSGEYADEWRELVGRFPDCPFGVISTDIEIEGIDRGVVLSSNGPSPDGYWAIASASSGQDFVMVVGGGYASDAATLEPAVLAGLAAEILADLG